MDNSTFYSLLDQILEEHELEFPTLPLIWQSQFPGGCDIVHHTTRKGQTPVEYWVNYTKTSLLPYNYPYFPEWDRIAFARMTGNYRHYLDISPLFLRPDGHVSSQPGSLYQGDCLHFCQPVVNSLIPRLVFKMLIEFST